MSSSKYSLPTGIKDEAMSDLDLAVLQAERAIDLATSKRATAALLSSIGNNHAGTYRSTALDAMPKFARILGSDSGWPQHATLETLIDLCGSFEPDSEEFDPEALATALVTAVRAMKNSIEVIALSGSTASTSASDLLEIL